MTQKFCYTIFHPFFFLFLCCLNSLGKAIFKLPQWASITHSGLIIIIKIRPLWSKSCVFFIIAQFISVVFCGPADLIDRKLTTYQFLYILTDRQTDTVRYRSDYPSLKKKYIRLAKSHTAISNKYKNKLNNKGKEPKNSAIY